MKKYPFGVSFIVPAFNESKNIKKCIWAIEFEIERHPEIPCEIIVIDNNSTDDTAQIALRTSARVIFEKEKGVVHARNAGYKEAKYSYLANIDADNILPRGWLDTALREIQKPNISAVSGPLWYTGAPYYINAGGKVFYLLARVCHHLVGPTIQGGNYMIKKEVLDQMDGYDTSYEFYGEDTNTAQMASKFGQVKLVPELQIYSDPRRIEGQGLIKTIWKYTSNYFSVSLFGKPTGNSYRDFR
jgi:glycosyltransferase involved in cell wall biosynthesis